MLGKIVTDEDYRFRNLAIRGIYKKMPDREYLQRMFKATMGYSIDIDHPVTFNEKLQWLKLYDRNEQYTTLVDKFLVKGHVANLIGEEYIVPTLSVWDNADQIDFSELPDKFVLKCNHNSGLGMCICEDKRSLDINKTKAELRKGLAEDYYSHGREWPYKYVKRKIICEQFMSDPTGELPDYKIHCFNGEPKLILVCKNRFTQSGVTEDFFSKEWKHIDVKRPNHACYPGCIEKPRTLDLMLELASVLSQNIRFVRIDFYDIRGRVYFGEITFYPTSGFAKFEPEEYDKIFGEWIIL